MDELRNSPYHRQFALKLCAAFIAQQQGITLAGDAVKLEHSANCARNGLESL